MEIIDDFGDGRMVIEVTPEENRALVEIAVNHILKESIKRLENEHRPNRDGREVHTEEISELKDK